MVTLSSVTRSVIFISIILIKAYQANLTGDEHQLNEASIISKNYTLPPYITSRTQISSPGLVETESGNSIMNSLNRLEATIDDIVFPATPLDVLELKFNAVLSANAYCRSVTDKKTWDCANCLKFLPDGKLIHTFSSLFSDTTGYILTSDLRKTIYLTFRGTNSLRQLATDMILTRVKYPPFPAAEVHKGSLDSIKEVNIDYFFFVQQQLTFHPDYKIVINGHSLGAVHAILAGMDLYQRDARVTRNNLSIYTVGSPRIGDSMWALYVASTGIPIFRSVHKKDVIPHAPSRLLGYAHVGIETWEDPDNIVRICPSNTESKYCSNIVNDDDTNILDHLTYFGINEGLCLQLPI